MKKSTFTTEQIIYALRQAEQGTSVVEVCRSLGISEQTFYRWKKRFAGMGVAELQRLRQLEDENRKLKQLVADLSLDKHMLQFCGAMSSSRRSPSAVTRPCFRTARSHPSPGRSWGVPAGGERATRRGWPVVRVAVG